MDIRIILTILTIILTMLAMKVEEENMDRPLQDLPQIQIPLTRPQDTGQSTQGKMNVKDLKEKIRYNL